MGIKGIKRDQIEGGEGEKRKMNKRPAGVNYRIRPGEGDDRRSIGSR